MISLWNLQREKLNKGIQTGFLEIHPLKNEVDQVDFFSHLVTFKQVTILINPAVLSSQSEFYLTIDFNRSTIRSTLSTLKFHPKHVGLISFYEDLQVQMKVFIQLIPVNNPKDAFAFFVSLFQ